MYGIVCIYKLCYSTKVYSSITTRYVIVCFTYVLQVDILHVKHLPSIYGNFLFGQYDLLGRSDQTVFYSEEQSCLSPVQNDSEVSVDFNHCQVIMY